VHDIEDFSLGYASKLTIADGLSAVIGTPCHFVLSALPHPSAERHNEDLRNDDNEGLAAAIALAEAEARAKSGLSIGASVKNPDLLHNRNSTDSRLRAEYRVMALRQPGVLQSSLATSFRFVAPTVGEQMARSGLRLVPECIRGVLVRWKPAQDRSRSEKQWCVGIANFHNDRLSNVSLLAQIFTGSHSTAACTRASTRA
jgi:hypothetical protein